jgi:hypothetical protein
VALFGSAALWAQDALFGTLAAHTRGVASRLYRALLGQPLEGPPNEPAAASPGGVGRP